MKRIFSLLKYIPMLASLVLTAFIFANSYEIAFNKDLPNVKAIEKVQIQSLLPTNQNNVALAQSFSDKTKLGTFGTPESIKIPNVAHRIQVVPGIFNDKNWLARTNVGHYMLLSPSNGANIGTLVVYMRESWRTVNDPETLKQNDNIFLDTNQEWRYLYRITEIHTYNYGDTFIIPETKTSQLVLIDEDEQAKQNSVVLADLINVQNIQQ